MYYYQHHIGDYAGATAHLSWLEDAAYRRLLELYYRQEGPLEDDLKSLYRMLRAVTRDQKRAVENVLKEFFHSTPDGWRHSRCDEELERYNQKSIKARASAGVRWRNTVRRMDEGAGYQE